MKISIITVTKNSQTFLQSTINSVAKQTYKNIEYIIIDGKSTDYTIDIIEENKEFIDFWTSEQDQGMYDAINRGLSKATGDYMLILNSDDNLANEHVISDAVNIIKKQRLDYYYGNIVKVKNDLCKKVKLFNVTYNTLLLSRHGTFAPHPCFFISAALNRKIGGYCPSYKYASDYDYILRVLSQKDVKGTYINLYITKFRMHENSITASGKIENERKIILERHGYYKKPLVTRTFYYYTLWIYYKLINAGHRFKAGCI